MKFRDQFRTGWRNLSRQKLRTTLTVFAIVIGAVSVTVMLTLVTSARSFLVTSFEKTGEIKRVVVTGTKVDGYREATWNWADGTGTKITEKILKKIQTVEHVNSATLYGQVQAFESFDFEGQNLPMKDVGVQAYSPNGTIKWVMAAGHDLSPDDAGKGVVISQQLANFMGFKGNAEGVIGKKISMNFRSDMGPPEARKKPVTATVVGVAFSEGKSVMVDLDWGRTFVQFSWMEQTGPNGQTSERVDDWIARNGFSSVFVDVDSKSNVEAVQKAIDGLGIGVYAYAGKDEVDAQSTVFLIIGYVLGGIGGIALFVAAIGVINTMVMATLERTREIGIMRAIGATKRTVRRLFTVEAGVLGFIGGIVGIGVSYGVAFGLNQVLNGFLADNGISDRNVVQVPPTIAAAVVAVTTLIGMLAGRLPARRAANLDPVEALRYE